MIRILTALLASSADFVFHDWCNSVGIETPLATLRTTEESVAGRGVFAKAGIKEGDVAIKIPEETVLHEYNAASSFPEVAKRLMRQKRKFNSRSKWWRRLFSRRKFEEFELLANPSDWWQAELTAYSLACLEEKNKNHPWALWISQWQRTDTMQRVYASGVSWRDGDAVSSCVEDLHQMLPDLSKYKLSAAVDLRLRRFEELKKIFQLDDAVGSMYGILISRAIDLGNGVVGVIPMFDMINHSEDPNLALSFDGQNFELWALRDISEGEELFLCYTGEDTKGENWDEDNAMWNLVQWGIPQPDPGRQKSKNTSALGEWKRTV
jgi:hypothetical protein